MSELVTKTCRQCGQTRPLDQYHRDRSHPDGRASTCAVCRKAWHAAQYRAAPEAHRQAAREKYRRNPEAAKAAMRRYQQRKAQRGALGGASR